MKKNLAVSEPGKKERVPSSGLNYTGKVTYSILVSCIHRLIIYRDVPVMLTMKLYPVPIDWLYFIPTGVSFLIRR